MIRDAASHVSAELSVAKLHHRMTCACSRAAELGRILASLRARLGYVDPRLQQTRDPSAPNPAMEPWEDGYQRGAAARDRMTTGKAPISSVQQLLETLGVHVAQVDFQSGAIEAASVYELGAAPVILLNRRAAKFDYPLARRAVLAHELCHLLHDGGERNLTIVSLEWDKSIVEQRANGFAPSFLAPGAWVSLHSREPAAMAVELATNWGFSFEGAAWHLKNLRLIDPGVAQGLADSKHKPAIESNFESPLDRTPPDQFGIEADTTSLVSASFPRLQSSPR